MPRFAARVVKQKANVSRPGAKGWSRELIHNDDRYEDVINESSGRLFAAVDAPGPVGKFSMDLTIPKTLGEKISIFSWS